MAYQFVHVETYSVKDGAGVAAEAGRKPAHSHHIKDPRPPVLLAGVDPVAAFEKISKRHAAAREKVVVKGVTKERRMRSDQQVMLAAVASYPTPTAQLNATDPEFVDWQKRVLRFMEAEHGPALSAVLHLDESHPHIHYITAPDLVAGQRMPDIHRGLRAKADAGGNRGSKAAVDKAYKSAMRDYQDAYHDQVGKYHAQARLGPRAQRLSRSEWKSRQVELERLAKGLSDARRVARKRELLESRLQALQEQQRLYEARKRALVDRERAVASAAGTWWGRLTSVLTLGRKSLSRQLEAVRREERAAVEKVSLAASKARATSERLEKQLAREMAGKQEMSQKLKQASRALSRSEQQSQALAEQLQRAKYTLDLARAYLERGDLAGVQQILSPSPDQQAPTSDFTPR
jgi:hypothetical protein